MENEKRERTRQELEEMLNKAEPGSSFAGQKFRGKIEEEIEVTADLKDVDFSGCHFKNIDFRGNLEGCNFKDAEFYDCKFTDGQYKDCNYENTDLRDIRFSGGVLDHCNFKDVKFSFGEFEKNTMHGCSFDNGQMFRTRFRENMLDSCTLKNSYLEGYWTKNFYSFKKNFMHGCHFDNSLMYGVRFTDNTFDGCNWENVKCMDYSDYDSFNEKYKCEFISAYMKNCNFKNADILSADFESCHLENCDFSGADLSENTSFDTDCSMNGTDLMRAASFKADLAIGKKGMDRIRPEAKLQNMSFPCFSRSIAKLEFLEGKRYTVEELVELTKQTPEFEHSPLEDIFKISKADCFERIKAELQYPKAYERINQELLKTDIFFEEEYGSELRHDIARFEYLEGRPYTIKELIELSKKNPEFTHNPLEEMLGISKEQCLEEIMAAINSEEWERILHEVVRKKGHYYEEAENLIDNIFEFEQLENKRYTIEDLLKLEPENPEFKDDPEKAELFQKIISEFKEWDNYRRIENNIIRAKFNPNPALIGHMMDFEHLRRKQYTVKELAELNRKNPEFGGDVKKAECFKEIISEFRRQELEQISFSFVVSPENYERIAENIRHAGFKDNKELVKHIAKFEHLEGKPYTIKELADLSRKNPEFKGDAQKTECFEKIISEFKNQEMEKLHFISREMMAEGVIMP